jgi:hypothetical protein
VGGAVNAAHGVCAEAIEVMQNIARTRMPDFFTATSEYRLGLQINLNVSKAQSCYWEWGDVKQNPLLRGQRYRSVRAMADNLNERPLFPHPEWMVGIVLIFAILSILGGLSDPIWFLLGLPCILVLVLYIWARIKTRDRNGKSPDV